MQFFTSSKTADVIRPSRTKVFARVTSVIILLLSICLHVNAQSTKITGKVMDADTKEPLIGATIMVKGTTTAASAGLDGTFKLNVPATDGVVLVVSYISYITTEIPLNGKTSV